MSSQYDAGTIRHVMSGILHHLVDLGGGHARRMIATLRRCIECNDGAGTCNARRRPCSCPLSWPTPSKL